MEFLKQYEVLLKKAKTDFKAAKILYDDLEDASIYIDYISNLLHFVENQIKA